MARAGSGANLELRQPRGGETNHLAKQIRVGVFSTNARRFIISSVIGGSSVALRFATRPYRRITNDRRKPLARYGAMRARFASVFATPRRGTEPAARIFRVPTK